MFYIKTKINDDSCITTTITEANVFTTCIDCGAEVPVTLDDMIVDGHLDLFGIGCRCEECSYRYAMKHRSEPWAEQIAADYLARKKCKVNPEIPGNYRRKRGDTVTPKK